MHNYAVVIHAFLRTDFSKLVVAGWKAYGATKGQKSKVVPYLYTNRPSNDRYNCTHKGTIKPQTPSSNCKKINATSR